MRWGAITWVLTPYLWEEIKMFCGNPLVGCGLLLLIITKGIPRQTSNGVFDLYISIVSIRLLSTNIKNGEKNSICISEPQ